MFTHTGQLRRRGRVCRGTRRGRGRGRGRARLDANCGAEGEWEHERDEREKGDECAGEVVHGWTAGTCLLCTGSPPHVYTN